MADKKFIHEALEAHNTYRKNHGAEPLQLNKIISTVAQKWADHIAAQDKFMHSTERKFEGGILGENIAMKWTSTGDDFTGQQTVDQWYSEVERFDFKASSGPRTGHFTQVVWKDSKQFGIGKAKTRDGKWFVVANYYPAGNFAGHYAANVGPPKDGKITVPKPSKPESAAAGAAEAAAQQGSRTETSKTITTETKDGKTITKTVTTETTINPDGSKSVSTKTNIQTEGAVSAFTDDKREDKKEKKPQKMDDFIKEAVKVHNKMRKKHGMKDVKHNKDLSVLAQSWAEKLASDGKLSHSNASYKGKELGENVASKWSSAGADYTGEEVSEQWYSEVAKYDFKSPGFKQGSGHFTQVVWKATEEVGFGKAHGKEGRVFVVGNYHPAGNVMGHFEENVFQTK